MIQILFLLLGLLATPAFAQNTTCANKPASDNSNACANTRYVTTAITSAYPNTWLKSVAGTSVNGLASGFNASSQALFLNGTYSGSGLGPYTLISLSDTASSNGFLSGLWVAHNIGASAGEGSRASFQPILTINNPLTDVSNRGLYYIASFPQTYVGANLGGTAGANNQRGDVYGAGALVQVGSAGTYLNSVTGQETNVSVQSGASVKHKMIQSVIAVNSDAVTGSSFNAMTAYLTDTTATAKWAYGVSFGSPLGLWPFNSSSIIIGTTAPSSGTRVADVFLDCNNVTLTTGCIRSTGFLVGPSGATTVASLTSTGAVSGTTATFTGALGASTISSTGAAAGLVAGPRGGSGNSYQWYNPSGTGIKLTDGGSDLVTIDSAGAISTASNVTNLHNYTSVSVPTTSTCGTSPSVDAGSSNHAGKVTFGSATTACTLTFASAFANNAYCTVTPAAQPAAVANIPYISAQSKTAFTISGGTASASYYYTCGGN